MYVVNKLRNKQEVEREGTVEGTSDWEEMKEGDTQGKRKSVKERGK